MQPPQVASLRPLARLLGDEVFKHAPAGAAVGCSLLSWTGSPSGAGLQRGKRLAAAAWSTAHAGLDNSQHTSLMSQLLAKPASWPTAGAGPGLACGYPPHSHLVSTMLCQRTSGVTALQQCNAVTGVEARRHLTGPGGFHFNFTVTNYILVANMVAFAVQHMKSVRLTERFMKSNYEIGKGEYYRLVTAAFLHADVMHLLVNSYSLYNLGNFMEPWSGEARFTAIYLLSAIAGNITSYYFSRHPSVGASTSIFGLMGAELVFFLRHKDVFPNAASHLNQLIMIIGFNLFYGFSSKGIDNSGHIGGFIGGILAALLLGPAFVRTWSGYEDKPPVGVMAWKDRRF